MVDLEVPESNPNNYVIRLSKVSVEVDSKTQRVTVKRANGSVVTIDADSSEIEVTSKLETN
jgi:hypothetical protein